MIGVVGFTGSHEQNFDLVGFKKGSAAEMAFGRFVAGLICFPEPIDNNLRLKPSRT